MLTLYTYRQVGIKSKHRFWHVGCAVVKLEFCSCSAMMRKTFRFASFGTSKCALQTAKHSRVADPCSQVVL